jgi:hypothetical protein
MIPPIGSQQGPQIRVAADIKTFQTQAQQVGLKVHNRKTDAGKDCVAIFLGQNKEASAWVSKKDLTDCACRYLVATKNIDTVLDGSLSYQESKKIEAAIKKTFTPAEAKQLDAIKNKINNALKRELEEAQAKINEALKAGKPLTEFLDKSKRQIIAEVIVDSLSEAERALLDKYDKVVSENLPASMQKASLLKEMLAPKVLTKLATELVIDQIVDKLVEKFVEEEEKRFSSKNQSIPEAVENAQRQVLVKKVNVEDARLHLNTEGVDKSEIEVLIEDAQKQVALADEAAKVAEFEAKRKADENDAELAKFKKQMKNPAERAELKERLRKDFLEAISSSDARLRADKAGVKPLEEHLEAFEYLKKCEFHKRRDAIVDQLRNVGPFFELDRYNRLMKEAIRGYNDVKPGEEKFAEEMAYLMNPRSHYGISRERNTIERNLDSALRSSDKSVGRLAQFFDEVTESRVDMDLGKKTQEPRTLTRREAFELSSEAGRRAQEEMDPKISKDDKNLPEQIAERKRAQKEFLNGLKPAEREKVEHLLLLQTAYAEDSKKYPKKAVEAMERRVNEDIDELFKDTATSAKEYPELERFKRDQALQQASRKFFADNKDLLQLVAKQEKFTKEYGEAYRRHYNSLVNKPVPTAAESDVKSAAAESDEKELRMWGGRPPQDQRSLEMDMKYGTPLTTTSGRTSAAYGSAGKRVGIGISTSDDGLGEANPEVVVGALGRYSPQEMNRLIQVRAEKENRFRESLIYIKDSEVLKEADDTFPKDFQVFLALSEKVRNCPYAANSPEKDQDIKEFLAKDLVMQRRAAAYFLYLERKQKDERGVYTDEMETVLDQAILLDEGRGSTVTQSDLDAGRDGYEKLREKDLPGYAEIKFLRQFVDAQRPGQKLWYDEIEGTYKSNATNPEPNKKVTELVGQDRYSTLPAWREVLPQEVQERIADAWTKWHSGKLVTVDKQIAKVLGDEGPKALTAVQSSWRSRPIPPAKKVECDRWINAELEAGEKENTTLPRSWALLKDAIRAQGGITNIVRKFPELAVPYYMQLRLIVRTANPSLETTFDLKEATAMAEEFEREFSKEVG